MTADGKQLVTADAMQIKDTSGLPPGLHLNLQSPSLDVPQRIEIPLKYILNGLPTLSGTHMVYLHALQINDKETFVYYGKTKRGWMKRYIEHVKLAMKGSSREFPGLYGNAIKNRYNQLFGKPLDPSGQVYTGSYHVVCVAGLNGADANEVERYLIKKHSLSNAQGLNMV
ncbi:hypothetical protein QF042_003765 [Pedobacter sp. W3I1]|uniref:hypothetical protein n=1 Tax=Pedobacter sp. W3I1 TaxID=3042291 RepID=UPI0027871D06|nr:hypothetical protein [Pedobacter sp. W3I1]MDQ0640200.1 hypothetical protein [Pedobacter sp. W3I1]